MSVDFEKGGTLNGEWRPEPARKRDHGVIRSMGKVRTEKTLVAGPLDIPYERIERESNR